MLEDNESESIRERVAILIIDAGLSPEDALRRAREQAAESQETARRWAEGLRL